jgi:hypothetical protein
MHIDDRERGDAALKGEFVIERDALFLDLAELPETPSIFYEVPDAMEYDPRQNLIFLHEIADEISRPIARDDRWQRALNA